jgi:hypothetical protein
MLRNLLLATTAVALPISAAYAQSCQSQASMDALANATWNQVMGDQVAECGLNGSGPEQKGLTVGVTCVPITLAPGDVTPTSGTSITDAQGNTWSLYVPPGEDGNGHWMGGIVFNGVPVDNGYFIALRLVGGVVFAEEAKGSGWQIADPNNPGDTGNTWTYVSAPGPGAGCGDPGQGTGGGQAAAPADPASASAQPVQTAAVPNPDPAQPAQTIVAASSLVPTGQSDGGQGCPGVPMAGAVTPGSGSFSDAAGNTFAIDANNGDVASVNGAPINSGAYQTSQLAQGTDGNIYGQDENSHQWFELMGSGTDTWWQPLASVPTAIMSAGPTVASATGANPCSGAMPQNTAGQLNPMSGVLPNILQTCADPATTANPMNADLCSKAVANQALLDQIGAQLAAAQQAGQK